MATIVGVFYLAAPRIPVNSTIISSTSAANAENDRECWCQITKNMVGW